MYLSDYHTHCALSFDSKTPVEDMVRAGIAQGLQELCLTDHADTYRPCEYTHWEHDFSARGETFARADRAAGGKITVRRGIELGEAMRDFAYADELLSRLPELDFVIGSQHQLSEKYDWNDLYFMPEATEQEARERAERSEGSDTTPIAICALNCSRQNGSNSLEPLAGHLLLKFESLNLLEMYNEH